MLMRECSAKHPIKIFRAPYGVREIKEIGVNPPFKFCTLSHGKVIYDGNSYQDAEGALVAECDKHHLEGEEKHGRFILGKHKLREHKLVCC